MKNMSQQARAGAKGGQVSQANGYGHRWLRDEEGVLVAAESDHVNRVGARQQKEHIAAAVIRVSPIERP